MATKIDWRLMSIIENITDCIERAEEAKDPDFQPYIIAYAGALRIIQEQLSEEERKVYKLDFDIDKQYL